MSHLTFCTGSEINLHLLCRGESEMTKLDDRFFCQYTQVHTRTCRRHDYRNWYVLKWREKGGGGPCLSLRTSSSFPFCENPFLLKSICRTLLVFYLNQRKLSRNLKLPYNSFKEKLGVFENSHFYRMSFYDSPTTYPAISIGLVHHSEKWSIFTSCLINTLRIFLPF